MRCAAGACCSRRWGWASPALLAIAAVAVVMARRAERTGRVVVVSFVVATLPLLWGTVDTLRRGSKLPGEVQARLPVDDSLGRHCDDALSARELRPMVEPLLRELRERPQALVRRTYYGSDQPDEHVWITVRELAEEHLGRSQAQRLRSRAPAAPTRRPLTASRRAAASRRPRRASRG